ncbi:hypothetical protein V2J93_17030 [Pseudomonas alliivorans]|uniref:hypothetical protein n=1 Tax=Pseudomonas alliivorans TaxID=2810613 RepID=UPI001AEA6A1F|nr:hypothetical protein [Pseudomonas alliivorans]MBP0948904.1 hypothetical protein [Pseudomonas alliivorans]MEE5060495.1 hypothetical protein [Pseudomonas alliivorans]MEE5149063.1 hypothetical protein [Pseudomonas alliivorans]
MKLERSILITLAAHETCLQQVKRLTKDIRICTERCRNKFDLIGPKPENPWPDLPGLPWPNGSEEHMSILYDQKGYRKTHVWDAFQHREPSSCGWGEVRLHDGEIGDFLAEQDCVHCTRAWYFITERKKVRSDLGRFRRSIRALGKSAIKALEPKP